MDEKYERCLKDIGILLQKASSIFKLTEREHEKQNHVTGTQSFLLLTLLDNQEYSMQEIARCMHLDKSSVSRIVSVLLRDGLLKRTIFNADKRTVLIGLTPRGFNLAKKIKANREQFYSDIIAHLPAGHVREVMQSAETLISALAKAL